MEIFDFETGKKRDVKTLSGGETFKAALSLALGLADAIENKVGAISIDTLFIDEGFGTLDDDSLHQAIEILLELKSDNNQSELYLMYKN
jgi:exonuclease SbcC